MRLYYFTLTIKKLYVPLPYLPHIHWCFPCNNGIWPFLFRVANSTAPLVLAPKPGWFGLGWLWLLQCCRRRIPCHSLLSWDISLCIRIHCCVFYIFCGAGQFTLDMSQIQDVSSGSLPSIFGSSASTWRHRCLPPYILWLHDGDAVEILIDVGRAPSYIYCMPSIIRILDALFCNNLECWK